MASVILASYHSAPLSANEECVRISLWNQWVAMSKKGLWDSRTGSDHVLIHLEFQRLADSTDIKSFVQEWVATIQALPDHKHGQMVGWWTPHG
jgi:hypothetical protein